MYLALFTGPPPPAQNFYYCITMYICNIIISEIQKCILADYFLVK